MLYNTCLYLDPKGPALFGVILAVVNEKNNTFKVLITQDLRPATKDVISVYPLELEAKREELVFYHESLFTILFNCKQIEEVVSVMTDKDIFLPQPVPVVELVKKGKDGSAVLYFLHAHFPGKDFAVVVTVDPESIHTSGDTKGSITTTCIPLLDPLVDSRPDAGLCTWTMDELQVGLKTLFAGGPVIIEDPELPSSLRVPLSFKLTGDTMALGIIETFTLQACVK